MQVQNEICLILRRSFHPSHPPLPSSVLNLKASCKFYLLASPTSFPFNCVLSRAYKPSLYEFSSSSVLCVCVHKKQLTDWLPRFAMKQARMTCLPTRADTFPELRVGSMNGSKVRDDVGTGIVYNMMHFCPLTD